MKLPGFLTRFTSKASVTTPITVQQFKARAMWKPDKFADYAKEGYSENVAVFACVNEIALSMAGIGWVLRRKGVSKDSKESLIDDHPLLQLMRRPNEFQGGADFMRDMISYLQISGNSITEMVGPDSGPPTELHNHRPDRWTVIPDTKNYIRGYTFTLNGHTQDFTNGEILHRKLFNPIDEWYGLSPVAVAALDIDSDNEAKRWNLNLSKNDMKPPGMFSPDGDISDSSYARLRREIDENWSGAKNAGRPLIGGGGLKWVNYALSQKDADWLNGMKMSERRIYNAYQVPGELIGDSENKTYANYKEARKSFYLETIIPGMDLLRDDLNNWLTPRFGSGIALDYDKNGIEAIQTDRNDLFDRVEKANWMTVNEKRIETGLGEIVGGDVLLVPMGMVALNALTDAGDDEDA